MATITKFEDMEIRMRARELSKIIFTYIEQAPFSKDFKLVNQINASSGSVMDNIAEGFERGSRNEFINFLGFSKGSAGEVESQLYRALDRKYISTNEFEHSYKIADEIARKINKLISYLNHSEYKGEKFKDRVKEPEEHYGINYEFPF